VEQAALSKFKPLIGTDEATVDDKGRILVSKKKRDRLGDGFVVALGDVGCLVAYPEAVWDQMVQTVLTKDRLNQGTQQYTRLVFGLAEDELKFDTQGRVVIPQKMRDLARLKDKVVLVGALDRLEIWAKDEYDKYLKEPDGYGESRRKSVQEAYDRMNRG
jgi:MraZ protein